MKEPWLLERIAWPSPTNRKAFRFQEHDFGAVVLRALAGIAVEWPRRGLEDSDLAPAFGQRFGQLALQRFLADSIFCRFLRAARKRM
jgi:hypothetical protein